MTTREQLLAAFPADIRSKIEKLSDDDLQRLSILTIIQKTANYDPHRQGDIVARALIISDYLAVKTLISRHLKDGELDQTGLTLDVLRMMIQADEARAQLKNLLNL